MAFQTVADMVAGQETLELSPQATVLEASRRMAERRVGAVPVVSEGALIGIFTERDLVCRVIALGHDPARATLAEVMTRDPVTVHASTSLASALDIIRRDGIRHLPVTDQQGDLLGVISCRDIPVMTQFLRERWNRLRQGPAVGPSVAAA